MLLTPTTPWSTTPRSSLTFDGPPSTSTVPRVSLRDELDQNKAVLGLVIGLMLVALIALHPSIFFYHPGASTTKFFAGFLPGGAK